VNDLKRKKILWSRGTLLKQICMAIRQKGSEMGDEMVEVEEDGYRDNRVVYL